MTSKMEPKSLSPDAFARLEICQKCFAPDPLRELTTLPRDLYLDLWGRFAAGTGKAGKVREGKKDDGGEEMVGEGKGP